jgi:pyruvate/2-oxoglutarate dehydrogenase complex dihydrolipoamide acyltransferase (E2) component
MSVRCRDADTMEASGLPERSAMTVQIIVPATLASATRLSIGRWFKRAGDAVTRGEPVVEIDTDNLTHEIRAPVTGVLSQIRLHDGAAVEPATVVGSITEDAASPL